MHKHVEWDEPGRDSVAEHFASHPNQRAEPGPGDILSARLKGKVVRVKVEAYVNGTSIGNVVALIDPGSGARMQAFDNLNLGDTVRLPDESRAFEPRGKSENSDNDA